MPYRMTISVLFSGGRKPLKEFWTACTYGQLLSMFINEESNIRQLTYAVETIENLLGLKSTVYIMSEHPFHAQMPQK